jgi:hypothetical protein
MGGVFQVNPAELSVGANAVTGLADQVEAVTQALETTISRLAAAAGDAGLAAALNDLAAVAALRMLDVTALLGHIGESLDGNARAYQAAEEENMRQISAAGRWVR